MPFIPVLSFLSRNLLAFIFSFIHVSINTCVDSILWYDVMAQCLTAGIQNLPGTHTDAHTTTKTTETTIIPRTPFSLSLHSLIPNFLHVKPVHLNEQWQSNLLTCESEFSSRHLLFLFFPFSVCFCP